MYKRKRGLIIGFHGCTKQVASEVVNQTKPLLRNSKNTIGLAKASIFGRIIWKDQHSFLENR